MSFAANMISILGLRPRNVRVPRPGSTIPLEREYASRLLDIVDVCQRSSSVQQARVAVNHEFPDSRLASIAATMFEKTRQFQLSQFRHQIKTVFQADIPVQADTDAVKFSFVAENVALMRDIPSRLLGEIEMSRTRLISEKRSQSEIEEERSRLIGKAKSRCRLIGRDQVGKCFGRTAKLHHLSFGIDKFMWRTSGKSDRHGGLSGRLFAYAKVDDHLLPGIPIQCRCWQEPYFGDILERVAA